MIPLDGGGLEPVAERGDGPVAHQGASPTDRVCDQQVGNFLGIGEIGATRYHCRDPMSEDGCKGMSAHLPADRRNGCYADVNPSSDRFFFERPSEMIACDCRM
jgi:hypothetical protein